MLLTLSHSTNYQFLGVSQSPLRGKRRQWRSAQGDWPTDDEIELAVWMLSYSHFLMDKAELVAWAGGVIRTAGEFYINNTTHFVRPVVWRASQQVLVANFKIWLESASPRSAKAGPLVRTLSEEMDIHLTSKDLFDYRVALCSPKSSTSALTVQAPGNKNKSLQLTHIMYPVALEVKKQVASNGHEAAFQRTVDAMDLDDVTVPHRRETMGDMKQKIQGLNATVIELNATVGALNEQVDELDGALGEAVKETEEIVDAMEEEHAEELAAARDAFAKEKSQLEFELKKVEARIRRATKDRERHRLRKGKLGKAKLKARVVQYTGAIDSLEKDKIALLKQMKRAEKEQALADSACAVAQKVAADSKKKCGSLTKELETLRTSSLNFWMRGRRSSVSVPRRRKPSTTTTPRRRGPRPGRRRPAGQGHQRGVFACEKPSSSSSGLA